MSDPDPFEALERFFAIDADTGSRLSAFARLLDTDARRIGLIGFPSEAIPEQIARSLLLGQLMLAGGIVDVGSGAGFPGVPLAILGRHTATLIEPKRRAVAFLQKVARETGVAMRILEMSAQEAAAAAVAGTNVCARALAEPAAAVQLCLPLCAPGGRLVLTSGPGASGSVPPGMSVMDLKGPLDIVQRILMMNTSSPSHDPTGPFISGMGQTGT